MNVTRNSIAASILIMLMYPSNTGESVLSQKYLSKIKEKQEKGKDESKIELIIKDDSINSDPPFDKSEIKEEDERMLALMIYLEGGVCLPKEKEAIGYTAINRFKKGYGNNLIDIIKAPNQYSCFNFLKDEKINETIKKAERIDPNNWKNCEEIAKDILYGKYEDPTEGATHYFNPSIVKPRWNMEKMEKIGKIKIDDKNMSRHEFYREKILSI